MVAVDLGWMLRMQHAFAALDTLVHGSVSSLHSVTGALAMIALSIFCTGNNRLSFCCGSCTRLLARNHSWLRRY